MNVNIVEKHIHSILIVVTNVSTFLHFYMRKKNEKILSNRFEIKSFELYHQTIILGLNDSTCISPYQICDCHPDCPLKDDESRILCPWFESRCNIDLFPCADSAPNNSIVIF